MHMRTTTSMCAPQHTRLQALHNECALVNEHVRTTTQHTSPSMCTAIGPLSSLLPTNGGKSDLWGLHRILLCLQYGAVPQPPNCHSGSLLQVFGCNSLIRDFLCNNCGLRVRGRAGVFIGVLRRRTTIARVACFINKSALCARLSGISRREITPHAHSACVRYSASVASYANE